MVSLSVMIMVYLIILMFAVCLMTAFQDVEHEVKR